MKKRFCDHCKMLISGKEKYLKVSECWMENNMQRLNHAGDLCFKCWEEVKRSDHQTNNWKKNVK